MMSPLPRFCGLFFLVSVFHAGLQQPDNDTHKQNYRGWWFSLHTRSAGHPGTECPVGSSLTQAALGGLVEGQGRTVCARGEGVRLRMAGESCGASSGQRQVPGWGFSQYLSPTRMC